MAAIKEIIKQYVSLDNEIKELNKQAKPLKDQRTNLGEQIINYMSDNSSDPNAVLTIGGDVFKIISAKKKKINRENLEDTIRANTSKESSEIILSQVIEESTDSYLKRSTKK